MEPTLAAAVAADERGELGEWVQAFLRGPGQNAAFADGLSLAERWWLLFDYPLGLLSTCSGPDPSFEFPRDPERWEVAVESMAGEIKRGWQPPPLIASGESLIVRDGSHRYEALRRAGFERYWTIFYWERQRGPRRFDDSLTSARRAADAGQIGAWLQEFLHGSGGANDGLAGILLVFGRAFVGPVEVLLDDLLAGGFGDYDTDESRAKVETMCAAIHNGWQPPPLIVAGDYRGSRWHLSDGWHRLQALRRCGLDRYDVIFHVAPDRAGPLARAVR
jgi:hypothetical protein